MHADRVERYGHSREASAVATCSVGSLTSASRGRGLTGEAGFPSKRGHCDLADRACPRFVIAAM